MLEAPPSPFGRDWDALRLRDVRSFFARRPSERGVWEAKRHAEKARLAKFVREESCGFANRRGGYLVLGAEEGPDATWHLSGVEVPGVRELHDWVSSLMTALDPLPDFDVHEWRLSNGRRVVVVQVAPAAVPPVTLNGVVYLRRGSQTVRANAAAIRRLAEAGRLARGRVERPARKLARLGAEQLLSPFGLAVGHLRGRPFQRVDSTPERVASEELEAVLRGRWRRRQFTRLVADQEARRAGRQSLPTGWLTGWEVAEARRGGDRDDWGVSAHRRRGSCPRMAARVASAANRRSVGVRAGGNRERRATPARHNQGRATTRRGTCRSHLHLPMRRGPPRERLRHGRGVGYHRLAGARLAGGVRPGRWTEDGSVSPRAPSASPVVARRVVVLGHEPPACR